MNDRGVRTTTAQTDHEPGSVALVERLERRATSTGDRDDELLIAHLVVHNPGHLETVAQEGGGGSTRGEDKEREAGVGTDVRPPW